jgi:excisionase family DNA binding protein
MATSTITPELLSIPDAQRYLGDISRPTLYNLIAGGHITRVHLGRRAMLTRTSLEAYVQRLSA